MAIPYHRAQIADGIAVTSQIEITHSAFTALVDPKSAHKTKALCIATGGAWTFHFEERSESGGAWVPTSETLSLAAGESDVLRLNDLCPLGLRLVATRTAGTADVWIQQHDEDPVGAR